MEELKYDTFIFLSEEMKEKAMNMTEEDLDILAKFIAYSLNRTLSEMNNDIL